VVRRSLAAVVPGKTDVFVWAVIDWHFRIQRPQQLSRALADLGHRVFYVSNEFIDCGTPGFSVEPLDGTGRLFQVRLHVPGAPAIYHAMPDATQSASLQASVARLVSWTSTTSTVSLIEHPFWGDAATRIPNVRCVYDCMDYHAGFDDNSTSVIAAEAQLVTSADLVVVTSDWLEQNVIADAQRTAVIRNACAYDAFRTRPRRRFRDRAGRQVIGYYGAIGPWFDCDLVAAVAGAHPDALVVLVGADTTGAAERLAHLPNVRFVGEVPYAELPYWVHGFDVCLLPFRVVPLTLATNPVKVYEYLAAGKPVVGVALPEMAQFAGLIRIAAEVDGFVEAVEEALHAAPGPSQVDAMQQFASHQTWAHRAVALMQAIASTPLPRVSIVIVAHDQVDATLACLDSIERNSDYSALEILVVDNGSAPGTAQAIVAWESEPSPARHLRRAVYIARQLDVASAINAGLAVATGDYFILLDHDTRVTAGWVGTWIRHLRRDPTIGLIGPRTVGNETRVDMGCVAMSRQVHAALGPLEIGVDYCGRAEVAGLRIACANDVVVHRGERP
jgi:glycosyltransferase involved in cell wall biosynthesis